MTSKDNQSPILEGNDIAKLAELLKQTNWIRNENSRRALSQVISSEPERDDIVDGINYFNESDNVFSSTFITDLNQRNDGEAFLKLYYLIQHDLKGQNLKDLNYIGNKIENLSHLTKKKEKIKKEVLGDAQLKVSQKSILLASIFTVSIVMLMRFLGVILPLEFWFYDNFMWVRNEVFKNENQDNNILIVEITSKELQNKSSQLKKDKYISYDKLQNILQHIEKINPKVIGLNIFVQLEGNEKDTNNSEYKKYKNLVDYLKIRKNIVLTCNNLTPREKGTTVPDGIKNIGFSTLIYDGESNANPKPDFSIRRQLLITKPNPAISSVCQAESSFSYQMATYYLKQNNNNLKIQESNTKGFLQINNGQDEIVLNPLDMYNTGAYQGGQLWGIKKGNAEGDQILINYRAATFEKIPAFKLLEEIQNLPTKELEAKYGNKIILVGYGSDAERTDLEYRTPIDPKMPSVVIHAHMVSQIVNAVINNRPLLEPLPWILEVFCIFIVSYISGSFVHPKKFQEIFFIIGKETPYLIVIYVGVCYLLFTIIAMWLPIVPFLITLVFTPSSARFIENKFSQDNLNKQT